MFDEIWTLEMCAEVISSVTGTSWMELIDQDADQSDLYLFEDEVRDLAATLAQGHDCRVPVRLDIFPASGEELLGVSVVVPFMGSDCDITEAVVAWCVAKGYAYETDDAFGDWAWPE